MGAIRPRRSASAEPGFADIAAFGDGIVTRGVLLDVRPSGNSRTSRPTSLCVAMNWRRSPPRKAYPAARDALLVDCGREVMARTGAVYGGPTDARPGLHVSCARFVRDHDVAVLAWDMLDARPDADNHPWPVHGVLYSYGVPLLDNALLEPLATACAEERRHEFLFVVLPLKVPRGTGSPVNPIAMF